LALVRTSNPVQLKPGPSIHPTQTLSLPIQSTPASSFLRRHPDRAPRQPPAHPFLLLSFPYGRVPCLSSPPGSCLPGQHSEISPATGVSAITSPFSTLGSSFFLLSFCWKFCANMCAYDASFFRKGNISIKISAFEWMNAYSCCLLVP
jgi:hypothetical protein